MMKKIIFLYFLTAIWLGTATAASVESYVAACMQNQKNAMGPELCECVGKKAKDMFSDDEFAFFYAMSAKDQASISKYNAQLSSQEKMNVIMFTMKGPSKCAGELSSQGAQHKQNKL